MGWEAIRDEFYERHGDRFVVAWWNGIGKGSGGRQVCSFLTDRVPAYGKPYALASAWIDQAKSFDNEASALAFLRKQDELRPSPLQGWFVTRIADLELKTGYRANTKSSIIGGEVEPEQPAGPRP